GLIVRQRHVHAEQACHERAVVAFADDGRAVLLLRVLRLVSLLFDIGAHGDVAPHPRQRLRQFLPRALPDLAGVDDGGRILGRQSVLQFRRLGIQRVARSFLVTAVLAEEVGQRNPVASDPEPAGVPVAEDADLTYLESPFAPPPSRYEQPPYRG